MIIIKLYCSKCGSQLSPIKLINRSDELSISVIQCENCLQQEAIKGAKEIIERAAGIEKCSQTK